MRNSDVVSRDTYVVMLVDEVFAEMARVAIASLRRYGECGNWRFQVFDIGMMPKTRQAFEAMGVDVVDGGVFLPKVPAMPWIRKRELLSAWFYLAKVEAIALAARWAPDPADTVIFSDTDIVALRPVGDEIEESARDEGVAAVPSPFKLGETNIYARRPEDRASREWFRRWFGSPDLVGAQSWNVGLLVARAGEWGAVCGPWRQAVAQWIEMPVAEWIEAGINGGAIEQLTFSVEAARGSFHVRPLDPTLNLCRVRWTQSPALAAVAKIAHLSGPIKPWQTHGQLHPMTELWRRVRRNLEAEGIL